MLFRYLKNLRWLFMKVLLATSKGVEGSKSAGL
jgi:hypothetical protein